MPDNNPRIDIRGFSIPDYTFIWNTKKEKFCDFNIPEYHVHGRFDGRLYVTDGIYNGHTMRVWFRDCGEWYVTRLTKRDPLVRAVLRRFEAKIKGLADAGKIAAVKQERTRQHAVRISSGLDYRSPRSFDMANKNAGSIARHASIREAHDLTVQPPRRPYAGIM
jgi:hypothetical protein